MNTQKLQQLTDIIESKILQIAGSLRLLREYGGVHQEKPSDAEIVSGEALAALLEVKRELGLSSSLSMAEDK